MDSAVAGRFRGRTAERSCASRHRPAAVRRRHQDSRGIWALGQSSQTRGGIVGGLLLGADVMTFVHLWAVEIRRALHRRLVWILIGLALVGIALLAVIAFVSSSDLNPLVAHARGEHHPAIMADWWIAGEPDNVLSVTSVFLLMGALI